MASPVSDTFGLEHSWLCSRCRMEINPILIDNDDDTKPLNSNKPKTDDELLNYRSRKRQRVIDLTEEASSVVSEDVTREQIMDVVSGDEGSSTTDDEKASMHGLGGKNFPGMTYRIASLNLQELIQSLALPRKEKACILAAIAFLQEMHSPKRKVKSRRHHPQPGDEIESLLRGRAVDSENIGSGKPLGEIVEEDRHSWSISETKTDRVKLNEDCPPGPKILMRVWDDISQARIRDGSEGFLSGSNFMPLHTRRQRRAAIEQHASWKNRNKTAFISTTTDIEDLATNMIPRLEARQRRKGLPSITKITLINGNVDGMPALPIRRELRFYKCKSAYEHITTSWFDNEYVFLFRITRAQIVKTWCWTDVEQWLLDHDTTDIQIWYRDVLVPAYHRHEHHRASGEIKHAASCNFCGH